MATLSGYTPPFNVKRIAIIGSGPSGLASFKYLKAEHAFERIDVYEQQNTSGGVWNYADGHGSKDSSTSSDGAKPIFSRKVEEKSHNLFVTTAMYDRMITNLPKQLMEFSDHKFGEEVNLFPARQIVRSHLKDYAKEVNPFVKYSTKVVGISLHKIDGQDRWNVDSCNLKDGTSDVCRIEYDAVVVAIGNYNSPFIPFVPGLKAFDAAYPGSVTHSMSYTKPDKFAGQKVIVIGGGPSGMDISSQICHYSSLPLLFSIREPSNPAMLNEQQHRRKEMFPIAEFIIEDRAVLFEDGTMERNIDAVIFRSGYLYSYPFLRNLQPPIITDGSRVHGLYEHVFHTAHPTIAFLGLPVKVAPVPVSETQAAVIARVWSNRLRLPQKAYMDNWERLKMEENGSGRSFHQLPYPLDANYVKDLQEWARTASSGSGGKPVPVWSESLSRISRHFMSVREAYVENGSQAVSLKDLGFYLETQN